MYQQSGEANSASGYDDIIVTIVDYAYTFEPQNPDAWARAKAALFDALGCACESVHASSECRRLIGPALGSPDVVPGGFKVPGTAYQLDLLKGAFDLGSMIRYLDHNDAYPGKEWGHPSDNLGAILAAADIASRADHTSPITVRTVLLALIKTYEIQGVFQIANAFNAVGLDHVILVKIASTAVCSWLLALPREQALAAVSHAWVDGHPLRTYRQAPNTGSRKGWAAGDACMRALHLVGAAARGQKGVRTALSAGRWGFYDVLFGGRRFELPRAFGSWVVENVLFKINTAEGHGMTAVEAAFLVSRELEARGSSADEDVERVEVRTQEAAMLIINKDGDFPLHGPADRDHCLRYMVAVVLLKGKQIETVDYQDDSPWASDPRVEKLRRRITMREDERLTRDYHDPDVRSVANGLTVVLRDGTALEEILVEWPLGHVRREETAALVYEKARRNLGLRLPGERVEEILGMAEREKFGDMPVDRFVDLFVVG